MTTRQSTHAGTALDDRESAQFVETYNPGLVSVVVPVYNRPMLVINSLESIRAQTYRPLEVVVVDDASTDSTPEAVHEWAEEADTTDFRVRLHKKARNAGLSSARNTGIRQSGGEFVALLDSDDEWLPEKVELQVQLLRTCPNSVGLVYTGAIFACPGRDDYAPARFRGRLSRDLLLDNIITGSASAVLVRREVFNRVGGFDPRLPSSEDHDMWIRILEVYEAVFVDQFLVRVNIHADPGRLSNQIAKNVRGREMVLTKHLGLMAHHGAESDVLRRLAWTCQYQLQDSVAARKYYRRALAANRTNFRALFGLASSYVPLALLRRIRGM